MKKSTKGFSLIEVLITVLIMSVGLLSIAALQINAKKATYGAVQRTLSSELLMEMANRMRANATNLAEYTAGDGGVSLTAVPTATATTADKDLKDWLEIITGGAEGSTGGLISPTACISGPASGSAGDAGVYTLSIAWRGVDKLENSSLNGCGDVFNGIYGANNEYRRIMSIDIYISPAGFGV